MKKSVHLFTIFLLLFSFSLSVVHAQKKKGEKFDLDAFEEFLEDRIDETEDFLDDNMLPDALTTISKADSALEEYWRTAETNGYILEDDLAENELISDTYFFKAKTLYKIYENSVKDDGTYDQESFEEAIAYYAKVVNYELGKYYASESSKGDVHLYLTERGALSALEGGKFEGKEEVEIDDINIAESEAVIDGVIREYEADANAAYQAKEFDIAAEKYEKVYDIQTMVPQRGIDTNFLYNAATIAFFQTFQITNNDSLQRIQAQKAVPYHKRLIEKGYTGRKKVYQAYEKETGVQVTFKSAEQMNLLMRTGQYERDTVYVAESVESRLYNNLANLYNVLNDSKDALNVLLRGRKKYPYDLDMLMLQGNIYYKIGKLDDFIKNMKKAIENEAIDKDLKPVLFFNLGVVYSRVDQKESAMSSYNKAIALKPDYTDAYVNLAVLILEEEKEINDKINALGFSRKDRIKAKKLAAEKNEIYKKSLTYLEKARELSPENIDVLTTLKNIYYQLEMQEDLVRVSDAIETLKAGTAN